LEAPSQCRAFLTSASNLASRLGALGEYEQARAIDEDTFTRRRCALGDDYPDARRRAENLAYVLEALADAPQWVRPGRDRECLSRHSPWWTTSRRL
jgi:hypothetical protein